MAAEFLDDGGSITTGTTGLPAGDDARSVFSWVMLDPAANVADAFYDIFSYGTAAPGEAVELLVRNGNLTFTNEGVLAQSNLAVSSGAWHLVGFTYADGASEVTLYVDGVAQTMAIGAPLQTALSDSEIGGGIGTSARSWLGAIQNLQVYDTALGQTQVNNLLAAGLFGTPVDPGHAVSWWPLQWDAYDEGANGNDGSVSGIDFALIGDAANDTLTLDWAKQDVAIVNGDGTAFEIALNFGAFEEVRDFQTLVLSAGYVLMTEDPAFPGPSTYSIEYYGCECPNLFVAIDVRSAQEMILNGLDGYDLLFAGSGDDTIDGGEDDDWLSGGAGSDTVIGGEGDDELMGGTGADFLYGGEGEDFLMGGEGADLIDGGAGHLDLAIYEDSDAGVVINLALGTATGGYATGDTITAIEGLIGTRFDDILTGDGNDNYLEGGAGDDELYGGAGADELYGDGLAVLYKVPTAGNATLATALLIGNDGFSLDADSDIENSETVPHVTIFASGGGQEDWYAFDVTQAGTTLTLDVDYAEFSLYGPGFDARLDVYDALGNIIAENDDFGSGESGIGASDIDPQLTFVAAAAGLYYFKVSDSFSGDIPQGLGPASYSLNVSVAGQEVGVGGNDLLSGGEGADILSGERGDDTLIGGSGRDQLDGGEGNDTLDGGAGLDYMYGDEGDDVFLIASPGDSLDELIDGGDGNDEVRFTSTTAGQTLLLTFALLDVETVRIASATGVATGKTALNLDASYVGYGLSLVGNAGANTITGTDFNDVINGGVGADRMVGLDGNDTYYVDNAGDVVVEVTGEGSDRVLTAVSYTLVPDAAIETFTTIKHTSVAAIDLTGNDFSQNIWGNAGTNALRGLGGNDVLVGGAGADLLDGGSGRDTASYAVNSSARVVADLADASKNTGDALGDTYVSIENLTGTSYGDNLRGDQYANVIKGGAGDDQIYGRNGNDTINGEAGKDALEGGAGLDIFVFDQAPGKDNRDLITDFSAADDTMYLDDNVFVGLVVGPLDPLAFIANTTGLAENTTDRIIYETDTGELYFDQDGSDVVYAPKVFAILTTMPTITASDFVVV